MNEANEIEWKFGLLDLGVLRKGWRSVFLEGETSSIDRVIFWLTKRWKGHWRKVEFWAHWRVKGAKKKWWKLVWLKGEWYWSMVENWWNKHYRCGEILVNKRIKGALKKGWMLGLLESERDKKERVKNRLTKRWQDNWLRAEDWWNKHCIYGNNYMVVILGKSGGQFE